MKAKLKTADLLMLPSAPLREGRIINTPLSGDRVAEQAAQSAKDTCMLLGPSVCNNYHLLSVWAEEKQD